MAGRRRRPLVTDSVPAHLAARLRAARDSSGLTLRQLADRSGYSVGALSTAESGRRVPSWELVEAHVQSCGEDPAQWRQLWELAKTTSVSAAEQTDPLPASPSEPASRRKWIRRRLVTIAAVLAAVGALTLAAHFFWPHPATGVQAASDGTDPYDDHCKADEKSLDRQPVFTVTGSLFGNIVLMYSSACQGSWGYLQGPISSQWTIHIDSYRPADKGHTAWQFTGDTGPGSWNNILSTRSGCVYVEAYVSTTAGTGRHTRTACVKP